MSSQCDRTNRGVDVRTEQPLRTSLPHPFVTLMSHAGDRVDIGKIEVTWSQGTRPPVCDALSMITPAVVADQDWQSGKWYFAPPKSPLPAAITADHAERETTLK